MVAAATTEAGIITAVTVVAIITMAVGKPQRLNAGKTA